jgi:hypothetical protein
MAAAAAEPLAAAELLAAVVAVGPVVAVGLVVGLDVPHADATNPRARKIPSRLSQELSLICFTFPTC